MHLMNTIHMAYFFNVYLLVPLQCLKFVHSEWFSTSEVIVACGRIPNYFLNVKRMFILIAFLCVQESLSSGDRWILGYLGVRLLLECAGQSNWQEGFRLLHCLHQNGIHYVWLQPSLSSYPSPCTTAILAIEICLKVCKQACLFIQFCVCKALLGPSWYS